VRGRGFGVVRAAPPGYILGAADWQEWADLKDGLYKGKGQKAKQRQRRRSGTAGTVTRRRATWKGGATGEEG